MKLAIRLARIFLAVVFLYAGIVKLGTSERFAITIAQFFILPQTWVIPFANTLPWVEIVVGILLLVPRTARYPAFSAFVSLTAYFSAAVLLTAFLITLAWAQSQGFTVDCGCFGATEDEPVPGYQIPYAIARDIALLALTLLLAVRRLR